MSRRCGDCSACCTTIAIPELDKPSGEVCENCKPSYNACTIHAANLPQVCADFKCMWLDGHLPAKDKPNSIGVMFMAREFHEGFHAYVVTAIELKPRAITTGRGLDVVNRLAEGVVVVVMPFGGGNPRIVARDAKIVERVRRHFTSKGIRI